MVPASASTPTLISGKANLACSSITMMSVPSTISKPPPQAMPLTAAISGFSGMGGELRAPKPPTPQSSSHSSPVAAGGGKDPMQPPARREVDGVRLRTIDGDLENRAIGGGPDAIGHDGAPSC